MNFKQGESYKKIKRWRYIYWMLNLKYALTKSV